MIGRSIAPPMRRPGWCSCITGMPMTASGSWRKYSPRYEYRPSESEGATKQSSACRWIASLRPQFTKSRRLSCGLEVDLLDPLGPEYRLAARPSGRGGSALADRLEQDAPPVRVKVRKRGGRAESCGQPRA